MNWFSDLKESLSPESEYQRLRSRLNQLNAYKSLHGSTSAIDGQIMEISQRIKRLKLVLQMENRKSPEERAVNRQNPPVTPTRHPHEMVEPFPR